VGVWGCGQFVWCVYVSMCFGVGVCDVFTSVWCVYFVCECVYVLCEFVECVIECACDVCALCLFVCL